MEDLVNNTPKSYEGFDFHSQKGKAKDIVITLKNKNNGNKVDVECSSIWGFRYKDRFFRVVKNGPYWTGDFQNFYVLFDGGKDLFMWSRGERMLEDIKKGRTKSLTNMNITSFATASLDGEFLALLNSNIGGKWGKFFREAGKQFFTDNPELSWLQECAQKNRSFDDGMYTYWSIQNCLTQKGAQGE